MSQHRIVFGDSRDVLAEIENESVALVVTSPPYFVGREYESYLKDEHEYWELMHDVFSHMERIIEPFGKVVINFADRFANHKLLGRTCEILYSHKFDAIMQKVGFDLWARVIWDKNKVPFSTMRYLVSPANKTGQMRVATNWEYAFVWRKRSKGKPPHKNTDMTDDERVQWTDSIWTIDSVHTNEKVEGFQLAKFPEELPRRFIKAYTEPGDTILDPFGGTCTTTYVANQLGRSSICVEKNPAMEDYIRNYLGVHERGVQEDMFSGIPNIEVIK